MTFYSYLNILSGTEQDTHKDSDYSLQQQQQNIPSAFSDPELRLCLPEEERWRKKGGTCVRFWQAVQFCVAGKRSGVRTERR